MKLNSKKIFELSKVSLFVISIFASSCEDKSTKSIKKYTDIAVTPIMQEENAMKVPDSLNLILDQNLNGDFNGDNRTDFASLVENKKNKKIGVLISHDSKNRQNFVFGAGQEIDNMTDLSWIEVFEIIPKGEIIAPDLVDPQTGDILGPDRSKNFELIGEGIFLGVEESHGGVIIFWNGIEYNWYHVE